MAGFPQQQYQALYNSMHPGSLNNLIIILVFGALILLAFLKFANPYNVNKKANFWFGLFLLLWASFWMEEIVLLANIGVINKYVTGFIHYLQIFLCVFFYLSIVSYINPNFKFQSSDSKHLIIPGLFLAITLVQFLNEPNGNTILPALAAVLIIFQSVLYTGIAFLKIRRHQKHVQQFSSDTIDIDLGWLERIIIILFVTSLLFAAYSFLNNMPTPNASINFVQLVAVFFIAYYSAKQKEIYPIDEKQRTELIAFNEAPLEDSKRKILADHEIVVLKLQLTKLMEEHKPYLDSELNLVKLADLMSLTSHQLSYLINTGFQENFFQFINKYRVEKAKELLLNTGKDNLSMLGIAFESGFNSKTSFNTTFKKITNQTPSEFKKNSSVL